MRYLITKTGILNKVVLSIFLLSTAAVSVSHAATAEKDCKSLLSRTNGSSEGVPEVIQELIKLKVLFNYSQTFSLTNQWCNQNRATLGSSSPKRQKESALDSVLIKDNGELSEELDLWYHLAEYLWVKQKSDYFSESISRIIRLVEKHAPSKAEFISLYAALLREYFSAIKGSSKSLTAQYNKVVLESKAGIGTSHFKQDLKKGAALGVVTGAGILAMHFAFGAVALVPDLILLATAGPSATLLPSAYRFTKGMILSLQPAKYLYIYQGDELVKALDEIFGAKLRRGYKSHMYWSLHEGVGQSMRFAYNLDLNNYNPDFTTLPEAEEQMNGIVNEFLLFSEDLNQQKITLTDGIDTLLAQARSFQEQEALLAKSNSVEIKLKMLKIINTLHQMLKIVIEKETQLNTSRIDKTTLLQKVLTSHSKRLTEILPLITTIGDPQANAAAAARLSEVSGNWSAYVALLIAQSIQSQTTTNQLKSINDSLAMLAALTTFNPAENSVSRNTIKNAVTALEEWRSSVLVNNQKKAD